jgi:dTDP-4-amino-4,6-dideoxygalactose transaminase
MRESDVEAALEALRSGWLTMGPRIARFEEEFASYIGAAHAVAVSSGTAAVLLAVRALEPARVAVPVIGGGADTVRAAGAEPVPWPAVADDDPTPDPAALPDADAVLLVHPYGFRARVPDTALPIVEDCRAALGLGVGRAGVAACWSFADGRPIAMGEGGAVTTDDADLAARVRLLRQHAMTSNTWDRHRGHGDSYDVVDIGFNFRLDEPRAALGSAQLAHLDADLEARQTVEAVRVDDAGAAVERLRAAGIEAEALTPKLVRLAPGTDRAAVALGLDAPQ